MIGVMVVIGISPAPFATLIPPPASSSQQKKNSGKGMTTHMFKQVRGRRFGACFLEVFCPIKTTILPVFTYIFKKYMIA